MDTPRRTFLKHLASAGTVAPLLGTFPAQAGDDELICLGHSFDVLWAEEAAAWKALDPQDDDWAAADAAYERTRAVVHQIAAMPATTFAGLIVKVRACCWCRSGEPFSDYFEDDASTTDNRLAAQVLAGLLAIDGRPVHAA